MDIALVLGLVFGFGGLLGGFVLEGGHIGSLFLFSPIVIVGGGTLGACLIQFRLGDVLKIPSTVAYAAFGTEPDPNKLIELLVGFAEKARREGILSLESEINDNFKNSDVDPMLIKGAKLAIDGTETEVLSDILENEIYFYEQEKKEGAAIFEAAGGYSPTMGVIGTVMGLVHVLGNLSDPGKLGPAIAAAFVATLYGVALANVIYLPLAGKIKNKAKREALMKQLIREGIMSIQAGENPRIIREKLDIFVESDKRTPIVEESK
jgi:chemotaxis protein MotA